MGMKAKIATASLLLLTACGTPDVSLKTKVDSYTVPDEMAEGSYITKKELVNNAEFVLGQIEFYIEISSNRKRDASYSWKVRQNNREIHEELSRLSKSYRAAINYAKNVMSEKEYGELDFTFIKTDVNGIKSSTDTTLYCTSNPAKEYEPSLIDIPWTNKQVGNYRKNLAARNNKWPLVTDTMLPKREQKDLEELSRKLCKRYFSFSEGEAFTAGIWPIKL